jgi:hypothetical protein
MFTISVCSWLTGLITKTLRELFDVSIRCFFDDLLAKLGEIIHWYPIRQRNLFDDLGDKKIISELLDRDNSFL